MKDAPKPDRRILHTSDLHLQSFEDDSFRDFESLIEAAEKLAPDIVIIAGDLFDHHRIEDDFAACVARLLEEIQLPVVILPGNHDCLEPASPYLRADYFRRVSSIHVLAAADGETLRFDEMRMVLWGKPITSYNEDAIPLAGIPARTGNSHWHIAIAHGLLAVDEASFTRSYIITHDEIARCGWDYVALGHMNLFRCICDRPVAAYYSGSPAIAGGIAVVDLSQDSGVRVRQHAFIKKGSLR